MILKTKDYSIFKFTDDNRKQIDQGHVKKLARSISSTNLLSIRPITVNANMEVIDGQHRLLAAKSLGLEVYYEVKADLEQKDLIALNVNKTWSTEDYLNYFVKHQYPEYVRFDAIIKKYKMHITLGLKMLGHNRNKIYDDFKNGLLKFDASRISGNYESVVEIKELIKSLKSGTQFLDTVRAELSLTRVIDHENYRHEKFRDNLKRLIDKIEPKASLSGYIKMFADIHNWKNSSRVSWSEEEEKST